MCVQSCSGKTVVYVNTFTWLNIKPSTKDKGHISVNKHSVTKALHFMNIKWDTLNPTSLVLGGPSLHSYCLLWFIRRCMCLFDVLRGFAPVRWEKKGFENKRWICQTVKMTAGEGRFMLPRYISCMSACVFVCVCCWPVLRHCCVHSKISLCQTESTFFLLLVLASDLMLRSCTSCFLFITYSLKIWLERIVAMETLGFNHTYQRFFFSLFLCQF